MTAPIDRAAAALQAVPTPPLPLNLRAATLAALEPELARARRARRRRNVMKYASMGCLLAALGVGLGLFSGGGKVRASELLLKSIDNQLGAKSWRATITFSDRGAELPAMPTQTMFYQDGKMRTEAGNMVTVTDGKRVVLLDAKAKTARTLEVGDELAEMKKSVEAGARKLRDALAGHGKIKPVPPASIGDKLCPGYRVEGVDFGNGITTDMTYWIDAETKLPVRLVQTAKKPIAFTATTEYLEFNKELDPKLFDMSIPAGYQVEKLEMPDLKALQVLRAKLAAAKAPAAKAPALPWEREFRKPAAAGAAELALWDAQQNAIKVKSYRIDHKLYHSLDAGEKPFHVDTLFYQDGIERRTNTSLTSIFDGKRSLTLFPGEKTASIRVVSTNPTHTALNMVAFNASLTLGALEENTRVSSVAAATIGGKPRPGYRFTWRHSMTEMTYWLDEEKKLPLRLREVPNKGIPTVTEYLSLDEPLDAKLFDLAVPEGYELEPAKK